MAMAAVATPPGPRGHLLWGSLREYKRAPLRLLLSATKDHGDLTRLRMASTYVYLLNHPDSVERVLSGEAASYPRSANYDDLAELLGSGLLTSRDEGWPSRRHLCQPVVPAVAAESAAARIVASTDRLLSEWGDATCSGQAVALLGDLTGAVMEVAGHCLLGVDLHERTQQIAEALRSATRYVFFRMDAVAKAPPWLPTVARRRFVRAKKVLDDVVRDICATRRRENTYGDDILSRLLLAQKESADPGLTDDAVHDEALTILASGHETTAVALGWALVLLAQHPRVRSDLEDEIDGEIGGAVPTMDDLALMPLARMVINEALRLYPPVWSFSRQALCSNQFHGYVVPAGSLIVIAPYCLHRHQNFWERPEDFDPLRFDKGRQRERHPFAFLPFGAGPRACIGAQFAMSVLQLMLVRIVQRRRLDLVPGFEIDVCVDITTRPRQDFLMSVTTR